MGSEIEDQLKKLNLIEKSAISLGKLESDYVLDFAVQSQRSQSDGILAATSSNYNIRLYSRKDLANVGSIKGHTDVVTGVTFGKTEPSLLYSSSLDESVSCWDLRVGLDKEAQTFAGGGDMRLSCIDVDCTDRLVCAGTEEEADNAYILFWDRRKTTLLGCYGESHQRDITQVSFHPSNKDRLSSSCDDGLVCIFDVSQTTEDDALLYTFNAECSVNCIGWYGSRLSSIYCLTSVDTFHVWDTIEGDVQKDKKHLRQKLQDMSIDYIVDVLDAQEAERDILVTGTYNGLVHVVELVDDDVVVMRSLDGGHRERIRCCDWNSQNGSLVTGGEDSLLCLWSSESGSPSSKETCKAKVKRKGKKAQPY